MSLDNYEAESYDALPSLNEAKSSYLAMGAALLLDTIVRQLFIDHDMHQKYGVCLLHKHFSIAPTERLVEFHHTATPWQFGTVKTASFIPHHDGFIVPRAYLVKSSKSDELTATPYEFTYTYDEPTPITDSERAFFTAYAALLAAYQLQGVLGVCTLGDPEETAKFPLEITEGKANIMIKGDDISKEDVIEAVWKFSPEDRGGAITRACIGLCKQSGGLHNYTDHVPSPDF
ncbi:hypothetical protein D9611_006607 [Ephemerocybe angulata]|uniref:Uncharacterized protein n=1 Tax=Ephemerocybe angulata TaxID=980116 RepID=A0A8H5FGL0_9AGAR|nr:hypothetical protein D9611_006607 [Tulosesus angulatus]